MKPNLVGIAGTVMTLSGAMGLVATGTDGVDAAAPVVALLYGLCVWALAVVEGMRRRERQAAQRRQASERRVRMWLLAIKKPEDVEERPAS